MLGYSILFMKITNTRARGVLEKVISAVFIWVKHIFATIGLQPLGLIKMRDKNVGGPQVQR